VPHHPANGDGGMWCATSPAANGDGGMWCQGAANGNGGRGLPALAQAARATCRLARGAATRRGSFLTKNFAGGLFWHFTRAGGLMCQKFGKKSTIKQ
jgi:hypothetical protein